MTDILEQLSDAKGALRSFATLKGAFSAAEAAVQAIEAARAEIAALREARDAARDDIPDDAYNVPTGTPEQIAADYAALGLPATPQDDAERDWQAWDAELATPEGQAKLARLATDVAPVRLTRAQREVERAARFKPGDEVVYIKRYGWSGKYEQRQRATVVKLHSKQVTIKIANLRGGYFVEHRVNADNLEPFDEGKERIYALKAEDDLGRAALRDAGTGDDARDATRDGGGER